MSKIILKLVLLATVCLYLFDGLCFGMKFEITPPEENAIQPMDVRMSCRLEEKDFTEMGIKGPPIVMVIHHLKLLATLQKHKGRLPKLTSDKRVKAEGNSSESGHNTFLEVTLSNFTSDDNGKYMCDYYEDSTGIHMEETAEISMKDHCNPDPCQNGAKCGYDGKSIYTCFCLPGYNGDHCENDIDDCIAEPCQNGGECKDGVNNYTCLCQSCYDGHHCENHDTECGMKHVMQKMTEMNSDYMRTMSELREQLEQQKQNMTDLRKQIELQEQKMNQSGKEDNYRVLFKAQLYKGDKFVRGANMKFTNVIINEGGAYDGDSGEFVAPVSGYYFFYVGFMAQKHFFMIMDIRTSTTVLTRFGGVSEEGWRSYGEGTCVARLDKGEKVYVYVKKAREKTMESTYIGDDGGYVNKFGGYLLKAL